MSTHLPGTIVRTLRLARGLSIKALAEEAGITTLALSNIEIKQARPQRETVLALLQALEASSPVSITQRKELLGAFGYSDADTLPSTHDIERAIAAWEASYLNSPLPAYLVDYAQRIHDWNAAALRFLGTTKDALHGITVFDLLFAEGNRPKLHNAEEVLEKTVDMMWHEFQPFSNQPWCVELLSEACGKYPVFAEMYASHTDDTHQPVDLRTIEQVILLTPDGSQLTFRIIGVDLVSDPRFRAITYVPANPQTMELLGKLLPTD